jgi:flagellar hook-associated protein 3 FlgL
MLNRIGDFAQAERMTTQLLQAQTRSRIAQAQISSGKVSDRFQDLAPDVERLIDVRLTLQQNQQYQQTIAFTDKKLVAMESVMAGLFDLATRAQTLAVQRTSDPDVGPGLMASEFENLLDQTVSFLNEEMDGRYLFGGSQTARKPVELDPAFASFGLADDTYYQGDGLDVSVRVDVDVEIETSMSADRNGFRELIGGLRGLINGDVLNDDVVLENSLGLIHESLSKIADYQAELGIRQSQMARINESHLDAELYLNNRISEIENVDVTEAITRLAEDQVLLESAMATMARLNQLNLVDYL